jgi:glutaredoxin
VKHSLRIPSGGWLALVIACAALLLSLAAPAGAEPAAGEKETIEVFSQRGCPRCEAAQRFLDELRARRPGVGIVVHDLAAKEPARRLEALAAEKGAKGIGAPTFLIRGVLIIGWDDAATTGRAIEAALSGVPPAALPAAPAGAICGADPQAPCAGDADPESVTVRLFGRLSVKRLGLPLFTFVLGLIDGTNPCAMWVLLYLLAILVNLRSRAKMLAIAGTFVLVSGLAYFAFMAAWLSLFRLIGYSRVIQGVLGAVAVGFGLLNLKDAVAPGHGPSLSIPESAKPGIYARTRAILRSQHMAAAVAGAAVLAVLVNMVELLCTAGLPALYTNILAARHLPWWQHALYLGLYNVAYMLDDAVMLGIAIVTLSRRKLQERGGRILKGVSGAVMLALGAIMLLRPQWLR